MCGVALGRNTQGQPVSCSVSKHKLSDIVQEVVRTRRERLDSRDFPSPFGRY